MGRPNLKVILKSVVDKIILERNGASDEPRATGVRFIRDGKAATVKAKENFILSAGVFNSPKLLELSGIGDPEILKQPGIEVQVPNAHVGTNLQDHILCSVSFEAAEGIFTGDDMMRQDPAAIQFAATLYQEHKAGPLATNGVTSFGYLPTVDFAKSPEELQTALKSLTDGTLTHPSDQARLDILHKLLEEGKEGTGQYIIFPGQTAAGNKDSTSVFGAKLKPGNYISLVVALSHPLSTGSTHITSADFNTPPKIDHKYLTKPLDLDLHARHVRYLETIASSAPFNTLLKPGGRRNDSATFFKGDLDKAKNYVKNASSTNWHSVGTCAMAPKDKGGVVDAELSVHGVQGLKICDASVIPFVPQCNTQSVVYALAERAADIIKGKA